MNPWLNTLQRSYQSIKESLIEKITQIKDPRYPGENIPLVTDTSEGNILVLIISLFSAIAEVIHVYIDNLYRESFLSTATRYDSVTKHLDLIDYRPALATASIVEVTFTRDLTSNEINTSINQNIETLVATDEMGNQWALAEPLNIPAHVSMGKATFIQHRSYMLGTSILQRDKKNRLYVLVPEIPEGQFLEEGTLNSITIGNNTYTSVKTFAYSKPTDRHFRIETVGSRAIAIRFGDNKFGKQPENSVGSTVTFGKCYLTAGAKGNILEGSITSVTPNITNTNINNIQASSGGTDYEDFQSLKFRAPLSVKTLGVAITRDDILNLVKQQPQVARADMEYLCGQTIKVYVSGIGSKDPNNALCERVKEAIIPHLPQKTNISVIPFENRYLNLDIEVTGKPSYTKDFIRDQILSALHTAYNIVSPSTANETLLGVRVSDMYALLDNLESVDYLELKSMYITPWLKPINTVNSAYISDFKLNAARGNRDYILSFNSSTQYTIYPIDNQSSQSGVRSFSGSTGVTLSVNDGDFNFQVRVNANNYTAGDSYQFQVMEGNKDIEVQGYFNISIDTNKVKLNIHEKI